MKTVYLLIWTLELFSQANQLWAISSILLFQYFQFLFKHCFTSSPLLLFHTHYLLFVSISIFSIWHLPILHLPPTFLYFSLQPLFLIISPLLFLPQIPFILHPNTDQLFLNYCSLPTILLLHFSKLTIFYFYHLIQSFYLLGKQYNIIL
jgi:hypothetical protein